MKARGAAWILGGLLLAACALIVLVSTHGDRASDAISARAVSGAVSSDVSESTELVRADAATDASHSEREYADSDTSHSSSKRLRFHHPDGKPAAGLELYRADWRSEKALLGLAHQAPQWLHHLDSHGEIDVASTRDLGGSVAVRRSNDCVEIFPLDPTRADYELTPLIEQEFALANAPIGRELALEVHIGNEDFRRCSGSFDRNVDRVAAFADEVSARIWTDEHLVIAYRRMKVSSARPVVLKLPRGEYMVECASSTVGAWMHATTVTVDGTPIRLPLMSVPVTQALLKRDENGNLRVPDRVQIYTIGAPDKGNERMSDADPDFEPHRSAQADLDFEVDGDRLLISERWRDPANPQDAKYALRFYWPDGSITNTAAGSWENLLDTVALCGQ